MDELEMRALFCYSSLALRPRKEMFLSLNAQSYRCHIPTGPDLHRAAVAASADAAVETREFLRMYMAAYSFTAELIGVTTERTGDSTTV